MPVESTHPDYARKLPRWKKNRDAYEGEDAVKERDEAYLVSPGGFTPDEYRRYKMRAKWFGATSRTVQGLTGAVFQKDPIIETSDAVELHMDNITLTDISASVFAQSVLNEVELMGRYGVLLDYDTETARPYWSGIPAESITNWYSTYEGGVSKLSLLVIRDCFERLQNGYDIVRGYRYRVCYLNEDGVYEVAIFENIGMGEYQMMAQVDDYIPNRRGKALDFIPFRFFGAVDHTPAINRSLLDDLVDINYAYYRHSADYEHGLFLTGVPTPVITGHSLNEGERVPIGSLAAWVFPNPEAKAYLLEYQGHGLESHERAMNNDKVEMATLGARLLEEQPMTAETLGAVQIRHSGETGSLMSMANLVSTGLTMVLRWHHWWNGDTENLNDERFLFMLNTDFSTTRLDPQELQALMGLWQGGGISKETLFWNLKQGEIVPDDREFQDEEGLIEAAAPARLPFGEMPGEDDAEDEDEEEAPEDGQAEGEEEAA